MAISDILTDIAPEFADADADRLARFVAYAAAEINRDVWGEDKADMATALLAAHKLTMAARRGTAGAVTSESVGELSRSYANTGSGDALDSTSYGAEFVALRRTIPIGPFPV